MTDHYESQLNWTVTVSSGGFESLAAAPFVVHLILPDPPTLLTPADESDADGTSFTWEHQGLGGAQEEFAFKNLRQGFLEPLSVTSQIGNKRAAAFSPDGSLLAFGFASSITVYDTATWAPVAGMPINISDPTHGMEFSPDGTMLAVATAGFNSQYLRVYDTSDWSLITGYPTTVAYGTDVSFSPDGTLLAVSGTGDVGLKVFNTSDWTTAHSTSGFGYGVQFSNDGAKLIQGRDNASPYLTIYNVADWQQDTIIGPILEGQTNDISFSPDGTLVAIGVHVGAYMLYTSDWSRAPDDVVNTNNVRSIRFSPDGDYVVVGTQGGSPSCFWAYRWPGGEPITDVYETTQIVWCVRFSSDGAYLAVAHDSSDAIKVFENIGPRWWDGTQWVDEETFIVSTDEFLTLPAGAWDE